MFADEANANGRKRDGPLVAGLPKAGTVLGADLEQVAQAMKKSIIGAGFEKHGQLQQFGAKLSRRQKKLARKAAALKDPSWFNVRCTELTAERKRDLQALSMRAVLDDSVHYRRSCNAKATRLPEKFEIGRVVDNAIDYYSSRIPKRQRKSTIIDELLADAKAKRILKQKYATAVANNRHLLQRQRKKEKEKKRRKTMIMVDR